MTDLQNNEKLCNSLQQRLINEEQKMRSESESQLRLFEQQLAETRRELKNEFKVGVEALLQESHKKADQDRGDVLREMLEGTRREIEQRRKERRDRGGFVFDPNLGTSLAEQLADAVLND